MWIQQTHIRDSVSKSPLFYSAVLFSKPCTAILLAKKYCRALETKRSLPLLRDAMASMGVESRSVFETWLEQEKQFLASLKKEPEQETLQMEYYQKLVNLQDQL